MKILDFRHPKMAKYRINEQTDCKINLTTGFLMKLPFQQVVILVCSPTRSPKLSKKKKKKKFLPHFLGSGATFLFFFYFFNFGKIGSGAPSTKESIWCGLIITYCLPEMKVYSQVPSNHIYILIDIPIISIINCQLYSSDSSKILGPKSFSAKKKKKFCQEADVSVLPIDIQGQMERLKFPSHALAHAAKDSCKIRASTCRRMRGLLIDKIHSWPRSICACPRMRKGRTWLCCLL